MPRVGALTLPRVTLDLERLYALGDQQRPDLQAAVALIERSERAIALAQKAFWPTVTVGVGYQSIGGRDDPAGRLSPDLVAFLWDHVESPVVTAVLPPAGVSPGLSVPVKLRQRLRGSDGTLQLYDDRLVYVTDRAEHGRVWRPADFRTAYQPDRHRLNIDIYEGGGDRTRTFSFDLKRPLPPGFLDSLWQWVHTPSMSRIGGR